MTWGNESFIFCLTLQSILRTTDDHSTFFGLIGFLFLFFIFIFRFGVQLLFAESRNADRY